MASAKDKAQPGGDIGEIQLNATDLATVLEGMIDLQQPTMIWGQPGIGKSDIVKQVAAKKKNSKGGVGRNVIDVRLAQMDQTDLRGVPHLNKAGEMVWSPPSCFPKGDDDDSIIFMDELPAADTSVQKAALQLVLDRRIGDYILPKGVAVVAAGNRETDRTASVRMISALSNRFAHYTLRFDVDAWKDWAMTNRQHPDIMGFASHLPQHLNTFNAQTNNKIFATPRTWAFSSRVLYSNLPEDLKMRAIGGLVGEGPAVAFRAWRKTASKLPLPEDILLGKIDELSDGAKSDMSCQYAMAVALVYKLDQYHQNANKKDSKTGLSHKEWIAIATNFVNFLKRKDNLEPDIALMALQLTIKDPFNINIPPSHVPEIKELFTKYSGLMKNINEISSSKD